MFEVIISTNVCQKDFKFFAPSYTVQRSKPKQTQNKLQSRPQFAKHLRIIWQQRLVDKRRRKVDGQNFLNRFKNYGLIIVRVNGTIFGFYGSSGSLSCYFKPKEEIWGEFRENTLKSKLHRSPWENPFRLNAGKLFTDLWKGFKRTDRTSENVFR